MFLTLASEEKCVTIYFFLFYNMECFSNSRLFIVIKLEMWFNVIVYLKVQITFISFHFILNAKVPLFSSRYFYLDISILRFLFNGIDSMGNICQKTNLKSILLVRLAAHHLSF